MRNAALAYQGVKVKTATSAELTLMLYDGAIKFCNIALAAMEQNDIQKANLNIIKAEKIILKLRETLNFKYPVANDFERVYIYIYDNMLEANVKKDPERLQEALNRTREMRDTWKEVMKKTNKGM